jgi:hypothetical protein
LSHGLEAGTCVIRLRCAGLRKPRRVMGAGGRGAGREMPAALALAMAACVLVGWHGVAGSVATGKEAFSPLRPVIPTHLPRFAFR